MQGHVYRQEQRSQVYHELGRLDMSYQAVLDLIRIRYGNRRGLTGLTGDETYQIVIDLRRFPSANELWVYIRKWLVWPEDCIDWVAPSSEKGTTAW